jgi:hypothetical protein
MEEYGDSLLQGHAGLCRFTSDAPASLHLGRSRVLRSRLRILRTSAGFLVYLVFVVVLGVVSYFQHSSFIWPFVALLIQSQAPMCLLFKNQLVWTNRRVDIHVLHWKKNRR